MLGRALLAVSLAAALLSTGGASPAHAQNSCLALGSMNISGPMTHGATVTTTFGLSLMNIGCANGFPPGVSASGTLTGSCTTTSGSASSNHGLLNVATIGSVFFMTGAVFGVGHFLRTDGCPGGGLVAQVTYP